MKFRPGQVYSPVDHPGLVWVVVKVRPDVIRVAYVTVPAYVRGARPGEQFDLATCAVNLDGLERLA